MIGFALLMLIIGALYIVFAFREPPNAIEHFFPIPVIFIFFREEHRVKYGRILTGIFLMLTPLIVELSILSWRR